ncbi:hypothetical protein ADUPG1_012503 [Aduncisulcus paluster]|uniref:Uncharacterized protein n=1 Tax=Aduncisulcus paluster TaxID=2918883 RepID=A0ABQ5JZN0_9EUKA|nr:hypothetical protein ADUPG1_012503 [Aduncisulcus paluster]
MDLRHTIAKTSKKKTYVVKSPRRVRNLSSNPQPQFPRSPLARTVHNVFEDEEYEASYDSSSDCTKIEEVDAQNPSNSLKTNFSQFISNVKKDINVKQVFKVLFSVILSYLLIKFLFLVPPFSTALSRFRLQKANELEIHSQREFEDKILNFDLYSSLILPSFSRSPLCMSDTPESRELRQYFNLNCDKNMQLSCNSVFYVRESDPNVLIKSLKQFIYQKREKEAIQFKNADKYDNPQYSISVDDIFIPDPLQYSFLTPQETKGVPLSRLTARELQDIQSTLLKRYQNAYEADILRYKANSRVYPLPLKPQEFYAPFMCFQDEKHAQQLEKEYKKILRHAIKRATDCMCNRTSSSSGSTSSNTDIPTSALYIDHSHSSSINSNSIGSNSTPITCTEIELSHPGYVHVSSILTDLKGYGPEKDDIIQEILSSIDRDPLSSSSSSSAASSSESVTKAGFIFELLPVSMFQGGKNSIISGQNHSDADQHSSSSQITPEDRLYIQLSSQFKPPLRCRLHTLSESHPVLHFLLICFIIGVILLSIGVISSILYIFHVYRLKESFVAHLSFSARISGGFFAVSIPKLKGMFINEYYFLRETVGQRADRIQYQKEYEKRMVDDKKREEREEKRLMQAQVRKEKREELKRRREHISRAVRRGERVKDAKYRQDIHQIDMTQSRLDEESSESESVSSSEDYQGIEKDSYFTEGIPYILVRKGKGKESNSNYSNDGQESIFGSDSSQEYVTKLPLPSFFKMLLHKSIRRLMWSSFERSVNKDSRVERRLIDLINHYCIGVSVQVDLHNERKEKRRKERESERKKSKEARKEREREEAERKREAEARIIARHLEEKRGRGREKERKREEREKPLEKHNIRSATHNHLKKKRERESEKREREESILESIRHEAKGSIEAKQRQKAMEILEKQRLRRYKTQLQGVNGKGQGTPVKKRLVDQPSISSSISSSSSTSKKNLSTNAASGSFVTPFPGTSHYTLPSGMVSLASTSSSRSSSTARSKYTINSNAGISPKSNINSNKLSDLVSFKKRKEEETRKQKEEEERKRREEEEERLKKEREKEEEERKQKEKEEEERKRKAEEERLRKQREEEEERKREREKRERNL